MVRPVIVLSVCLIPFGGALSAQQANEVFLSAVYLGAPTEWCATDEGVPVVITMDGPDIVEAPESWPVTVRERRGNQATNVVSEEHTSSLQRRRDLGDAKVVGRFSAEFRHCQTPWNVPRVEGEWALRSHDGLEMDGGRLENARLISQGLPFFRSVSRGSDAQFAAFGERKLFTANFPNVTTSQTFAAENNKE